MVPPKTQSLDVFTHVDFEGPAAIADAAAEREIFVRVHQLGDGDPLPELDTIRRLVVMGGPMGALDDAEHPFLTEERRLLANAVERGVPVLGVCLGAQLLAAALRARVYPGADAEIGAGTVELTPAANNDPVLGVIDSKTLAAFHWHGDTFDLPEGALRLASSDQYENQAFRVGTAYGFQFHIELRASDADTVRSHLGRHHSVSTAELAAIEPDGLRIIDAFLALQPR